MRRLTVVIFTLFLFSCTSTKVRRDHGDCFVAALQTDNKYNDTSRVVFIRSVVFDTTATLIHGYVKESKSSQPIPGAVVKLFHMEDQFFTSTNSQGEFHIIENLGIGPWNIYISHDEYICLYVTDVVKAGGQWFEIKLEKK